MAETAVSGMSCRLYFERAFSCISYSDIVLATLKTVVFGYLIAVVSSYLGFTTSRYAQHGPFVEYLSSRARIDRA